MAKMAKARILQVCAVDFTAKNFLLPLVDFLRAKGNEVHIACTAGDYFDDLAERGYTMIDCPISRSANVFRHIRSLVKLCRIISKGDYDVVHTHTPIAALIGRFAAWLCGTPIVFYTAHGFYFHENMPSTKRRFHIFLEKIGARFCNFIFVQSEEDRVTAIEEHIADESKILTIGNGVDVTRFNPYRVMFVEETALKEDLKISPNDKVVAIIGRLVREKGYFEFFDAAKMVLNAAPDTKFLVIGDVLASDHDASKEEIARHIDELGIRDRVIFAGLRDDIDRLLSLASVFVLPSHREGMPRSIIEAMAMGVPVVATNIRGSREEVVNCKTGFIVPLKDPHALAEKIILLLNHSSLARKLGAAGRQRVVTNFTESLVLAKQWEIYSRFLSGPATAEENQQV